MKITSLFLLACLVYSGCKSNPTTAIIQQDTAGTLIYKWQDTSIFRPEIYVGITWEPDTLFDENGTYRIMKMPIIYAHAGQSYKFASNMVGDVGKDSSNYSDILSEYHTNYVTWDSIFLYEYRVKDSSWKELHIKLFKIRMSNYAYVEDSTFFKAGIKIK